MKKDHLSHSRDAAARTFLEEVLFSLPDHAKLPGLRKLIAASHIGRNRLERILKEFEMRNLIEVRNRSGRYRLPSNTPIPIVFIHSLPATPPESGHDFIGGIIRTLHECAQKNRQPFSTLKISDMQPDNLAALLQSKNIRQAFIFGSESPAVTDLIRTYIPFSVSLLPRHPVQIGSELRDSAIMTEIQLQYLFSRNYRRIGFIHNVEKDWSKSPVQLNRLLNYYRIMAENGIKTEPEWVFYGGYDYEHFNRAMYRLMRCGNLPDAIIAPGSSIRNFYTFCRGNGIQIGKDLAVIGCDNTADDLQPQVTCVTNTPREIGRQAWDIMQKTLQGKNICEVTNLRIITGQTVPNRN